MWSLASALSAHFGKTRFEPPLLPLPCTRARARVCVHSYIKGEGALLITFHHYLSHPLTPFSCNFCSHKVVENTVHRYSQILYNHVSMEDKVYMSPF